MLGDVTKAPMITDEFGQLNFTELTASEIQIRFNALYNSNTKPRAILTLPEESNFHKLLNGENVYFSGLYEVK